MAVKEKILNYLKEQMGNTSLSERTLEGFANSYAAFFSDENALTDEVLQNILTNVKSIEGQYSHDLSSGLEEAKKTLTPPTQIPPTPKTPPAIEPPQKPQGGDEETKKRLDNLEKLLNQFKEEKEAAAKKQAMESLKKTIEAGLIAKGCQKGIFLDYALTQVDGEKDAEANIASLKEIYDKKMTDSIENGSFIPQSVTSSASAITDAQQKEMMETAIRDLKERHSI